MPYELNALGQPVGLPVPGWKTVARPPKAVLEGKYCRLEPLNIKAHADQLFAANSVDTEGRIWTYLPYGPFIDVQAYISWIERFGLGDDPQFYAIIDSHTQKAVGVASYLRLDPSNGVIEVGHICYSPLLAHTIAATEAMYLLMKQAFELGYRRYEWKGNALNAASRQAAQRLGFSYEGIFRQAVLNRGRNRDTAWYAIIDSEWPVLKAAFESWLAPENFDNKGQQKTRLSELTSGVLVARG